MTRLSVSDTIPEWDGKTKPETTEHTHTMSRCPSAEEEVSYGAGRHNKRGRENHHVGEEDCVSQTELTLVPTINPFPRLHAHTQHYQTCTNTPFK